MSEAHAAGLGAIVRRMWAPSSRRSTIVLLLGLLVLFGHLAVVIHELRGPLDHDDAQHLHMAWMQSQGMHPFTDYADNHSPLLHSLLRPLTPSATTPDFPLLDVPTFAVRARVLAVLAGTSALGIIVLLAYRITGDGVATLAMAMLLLGTDMYWKRAIFDVRPEPFALLLFWGGVLLATVKPKRGGLSGGAKGIGVGLTVIAFLLNGKWPLSALAVGLFCLVAIATRREGRLAALGGAALGFGGVIALGALWIASTCGLASFFTNVLAFNFRTRADISASFQNEHEQLEIFFGRCPPDFHPVGIVLAVAIVGVVVARSWDRFRTSTELGTAALVLIVLLTTFLELQFLYAVAWPQYYTLWMGAGGVVYASLLALARDASLRLPASGAQSPLAKFGRRTLAAVPALAIVGTFTLCLVLVATLGFDREKNREGWGWISYAQRHIAPSDRVWVRPRSHPIGARDASYYWTAMIDQVPASLHFSQLHPGESALPNMTEEDLPPCRLLAGKEDVRLMTLEYDQLSNLPKTLACLRRLSDEGRLCPTPYPTKYALVPRHGEGCGGL